MDYRQHGKNVVGAKRAGSLGYMLSRLGGKARRMRDDTIRQTKAFLKYYGKEMPAEKKEAAEAFAELAAVGKLKRIRILAEYHFWKNTLTRRMGQILFW